MKNINDAKLLERVEKIQRHFRNKHIPTALLADFKESVRPRVSADTRWSSQLDCYDTYIKNRSCMISIIQEHPGVIEKSIQTAIMDNNLYFKVVEIRVERIFLPLMCPGHIHILSDVPGSKSGHIQALLDVL